MKFLVILIVAFGMSVAWAGIIRSNHCGYASNVTVVDIKDDEATGLVVVTFSGPLKGGPACAAKNPNMLTIPTGRDSLDGITAQNAFKLGQAVQVRGAGICRKSGVESMSGIEVMK